MTYLVIAFGITYIDESLSSLLIGIFWSNCIIEGFVRRPPNTDGTVIGTNGTVTGGTVGVVTPANVVDAKVVTSGIREILSRTLD